MPLVTWRVVTPVPLVGAPASPAGVEFGLSLAAFSSGRNWLAESHLTQRLFGKILGRIERLAGHPT
jgi:hypothetical protein